MTTLTFTRDEISTLIMALESELRFCLAHDCTILGRRAADLSERILSARADADMAPQLEEQTDGTWRFDGAPIRTWQEITSV